MGTDSNKKGWGSLLTLENVQVKPPIFTNSVENFDSVVIEQDAKDTNIVVHPRFPKLVEDFLDHKRQHGSEYERDLYGSSATFTWQQEATRLITKRPLVFMGADDHTILRDGTLLRGDANAEWDRNGTSQQHLNKFLRLEDYLSYDEIMLGSLIGVSGPSYFINEGRRNNRGRPGAAGTFEPRGIIIGLVGARFEREDRMDSTHILRPKEPPYQHPALSKIFQNCFGSTRNPSAEFDAGMFTARMRISIDILLLEANERARSAGKKAYTYVVGLGLGVWQHNGMQPELYVDAFVAALAELTLSHVSTLEFAWISVPEAAQRSVRQAAAAKNIKVIFSRRNPAEKLQTDELLVLSYAWDGNAFPGNEYWQGSLSGSGDPAAACMSTIGELHNPLINPFTERIRVVGE